MSERKKQRPRKDNVIYANFGARTRVETPEEIPDRGVVAQLAPAAARFMSFVTHFSDQGRIGRGREYARAGNVVEISTHVGAVHARVAGSQIEPFTVSILLPYRNNDEIGQVAAILARTTNGMTRARRGLVDSRILDILIGEQPDDLRVRCDCPDSQLVCKHIVAVADRVSARIDADPNLVFQLRGLSLNGLEQAVMDEAAVVSQESTKSGADGFWTGRSLPDLPSPKVAPALEDSDMELLHKAMRTVSFTNIDQLRAVSDIEDMFDHLTR